MKYKEKGCEKAIDVLASCVKRNRFFAFSRAGRCAGFYFSTLHTRTMPLASFV